MDQELSSIGFRLKGIVDQDLGTVMFRFKLGVWFRQIVVLVQ